MSVRSRLQEAEAENPLLALAVGAIAALGALERALERGDDQPSYGASARCDAALAPDDPFVLATLGLLGLGRTLHGWLATAAAEPGAAPRRAPAPPAHGSLAR